MKTLDVLSQHRNFNQEHTDCDRRESTPHQWFKKCIVVVSTGFKPRLIVGQ